MLEVKLNSAIRKLFLLPALFLVLVGATGGSCQSESAGKSAVSENLVANETEAAKKIEEFDPVAEKWQKYAYSEYQKLDAYEAFAVFSQGGWADAGQFFLFRTQKSNVLQVVPMAKPKVEAEKNLSSQEWAVLEKVFAKADQLSSIKNDSFDGIVFEYWHVKGKAPSVKTINRFYIKSGHNKPTADHDELVQLTQKYIKGTDKN